MWLSEAFLCVFLVASSLYLIGLVALFGAQMQAAMYDITTNEMMNRHKYGYVQYPGTTPWSDSSTLRNLAVFFQCSAKPAIDWTRQYAFHAAV